MEMVMCWLNWMDGVHYIDIGVPPGWKVHQWWRMARGGLVLRRHSLWEEWRLG